VSETRNKYTVNGPKTFKGVSAIELEVDTDIVVAPVGAGTMTKTLNYFNVNSTETIYYGTRAILTASLLGISFTTTTTSSYAPPWRLPLNLASGQTFSNNTSQVTIETEGQGTVADVVQSQLVSYRFLGVESVSVPAGTFSACKVEQTTTITTNGVATTGVSTSWTIASGDLRGLFVKSVSNGNTTEAKLVQRGH
jgi:hypothetical protein